MRKSMVEFFRKSEGRGDKIARVNSIRITKSINLLTFCTALHGVRCDVEIFKLPMHSPFVKKSICEYNNCREKHKNYIYKYK